MGITLTVMLGDAMRWRTATYHVAPGESEPVEPSGVVANVIRAELDRWMCRYGSVPLLQIRHQASRSPVALDPACLQGRRLSGLIKMLEAYAGASGRLEFAGATTGRTTPSCSILRRHHDQMERMAFTRAIRLWMAYRFPKAGHGRTAPTAGARR